MNIPETEEKYGSEVMAEGRRLGLEESRRERKKGFGSLGGLEKRFKEEH